MENIAIRMATAHDLPAIHGLVRELAIYEKAEEEFIATEEEYRRDFAQGVFQAQVACAGEEVIGMILYYMNYSTWKGKMLYLEDFVVSEPWRGKGAGKLLFDAFIEEGRRQGCRLVKWQVLDWNEPALNFYAKYGATIEKEWWTGKFFYE
ncbi:MAG: hypothetical protein RL181_1170 [Bacteroidota bacterium]|jgi:GNAT superfamily N-acetyltransferase